MPKKIILITAYKANQNFRDDLIKKVLNKSLIEMSINKTKSILDRNDSIVVFTDSEEIKLICQRLLVRVFHDTEENKSNISGISRIFSLGHKFDEFDYLIFISPYYPFLKKDSIESTILKLRKTDSNISYSIDKFKYQEISINSLTSKEIFLNDIKSVFIDFLLIVRKDYFSRAIQNPKALEIQYPSKQTFRIKSYQDLWVCEKLTLRKRIIFRVIGNKKYGMGHVYRALTIAHEIIDHEIIFVSNLEDDLVVENIAGTDYLLRSYPQQDVVKNIISLKPDLVINDILDTNYNEMVMLKRSGVKVLNFEDIGKGAKSADLVVNEIFDYPVNQNKNTLWGPNYFILRDEFRLAKVHKFVKNISRVLVSFGGTDKKNLTLSILKIIEKKCLEKDILIEVVVGPGYANLQQLRVYTKHRENINLTSSTGIISSIMEKTQLAICSNGRTVFELAHMNIPAIIVSQHTRENTHSFADEKNGFIPLGVYNENTTNEEIIENFDKLVENNDFRKNLFDAQKKYDFISTKKRVKKLIYKLLDNKL